MPFKSQAQSRAAFSGALGPQMESSAKEWASSTPGGVHSLPQHVGKPGAPKRKVSKREAFISAIAAKSSKANPFAK